MSHLDNLEAFQRCWERYADELEAGKRRVLLPNESTATTFQLSLQGLPEQVRRAFAQDAENVLRRIIDGFYDTERAKLVAAAVTEAHRTLEEYECPPES